MKHIYINDKNPKMFQKNRFFFKKNHFFHSPPVKTLPGALLLFNDLLIFFSLPYKKRNGASGWSPRKSKNKQLKKEVFYNMKHTYKNDNQAKMLHDS